jgi:hypothetical protein
MSNKHEVEIIEFSEELSEPMYGFDSMLKILHAVDAKIQCCFWAWPTRLS